MGDNGQGKDYSSPYFLLTAAIAFSLFLVMMWVAYGKAISSKLGIIRRYEMAVFAPFSEPAKVLHSKLVSLDGRPLPFDQTRAMLGSTGEYVRWLYIPPLLAGAGYLYLRSIRRRYRTEHSMASLAKAQAKLFPDIAPVVNIMDELVSGDTRKGPWAVPMTEWEFAEKHKLAERGKPLDRDAARKLFARQLGKQWQGPAHLPPYIKGIYAALVLRIAGDSAASEKAMALMSNSYAKGGEKGLDVSFADAAIAKHGQHPHVQRILRTHAYVYTVMCTMLQVARADGVIAVARFTWLRPVDRRLFFALCDTGKYVAFPESSGIFAHWLFEKTVGAMCATPMVEPAVEALQNALNDYSEDDTEERLFQ